MHNECWIFIRDNAVDNSLQAIAPVNMIYSIKYMEYLNTFRTTIECEQKAKRKFNSYTCTCIHTGSLLFALFFSLSCMRTRAHILSLTFSFSLACWQTKSLLSYVKHIQSDVKHKTATTSQRFFFSFVECFYNTALRKQLSARLTINRTWSW